MYKQTMKPVYIDIYRLAAKDAAHFARKAYEPIRIKSGPQMVNDIIIRHGDINDFNVIKINSALKYISALDCLIND